MASRVRSGIGHPARHASARSSVIAHRRLTVRPSLAIASALDSAFPGSIRIPALRAWRTTMLNFRISARYFGNRPVSVSVR